jgi:ABC-type uncharacterized transport system auxiliary subunit
MVNKIFYIIAMILILCSCRKEKAENNRIMMGSAIESGTYSSSESQNITLYKTPKAKNDS